MLRLRAERLEMPHRLPALSGFLLQRARRIQLHARLVGPALHPDAGMRRNRRQRPAETFPAQHKIMVVTLQPR